MTILRKLFLSGLTLFSVACAHAQPLQETDSMARAEFLATLLEQILYAYKDFQITNQDTTCFVVETYREDGRQYVNFLPSRDVKIDEDEIEITLGGANECGRGISYEFDKDGKFVRRIYQR